MNETIIDLSKKLFDLFVVNDNTIAFQTSKYYIPHRFKYDYRLFELMINKHESLGVYQQPFKKDLIKWICLDFDCKTFSLNNIQMLIDKYVVKCLDFLDSINVNYLIEFSGKRGIHVWIIFNHLIDKEDGFNLANLYISLCKIESDDENLFHIDLYPKSNVKGNKYGSLVKVPLSFHKNGKQSFFINRQDLINFKKVYLLQVNLDSQLKILEKYAINFVEQQNLISVENYPKYKKQFYNDIIEIDLSIDEVMIKLSDSKAFSKLYSKIRNGNLNDYDRKIIVSCFYVFSNEFLLEIFKSQYNFNYDLTIENIKKIKRDYYPITMQFFYNNYMLDLEDNIDSNDTMLEYVLNKLELQINLNTRKQLTFNKKELFNIDQIIRKELNYMIYNDEVFELDDYMYLNSLTKWDLDNIKKIINNITSDNLLLISFEYKQFERREEGKENPRILITQEPLTRLITTVIIHKIVTLMNKKHWSYSYNLNLLSDENIFYPFLSSWKRFNRDVSQFFAFDLLREYSLLKIDVSKFYDSVALHSIYEDLNLISKDTCKSEFKRLLDVLLKYNNVIMRKLTSSRIGVPQGPAYARVLAELFMEIVMDKLKDKISVSKIFRYVDDIYFVYDSDFDGKKLLTIIENHFTNYGLSLNNSKTHIYGKIDDINKDELHDISSSLMNYISNFDNTLLDELEQNDFVYSKLIDDNNWLSKANFMLNSKMNLNNKNIFIEKFYKKILSSNIGRGSLFEKFYYFILDDYNLCNVFFQSEHYKEIPKYSLNEKVFSSVVYRYLMKAEENLFPYLDYKFREFIKDDVSYSKVLKLISIKDGAR